MKKIICLMLSLLMLASLVACNQTSGGGDDTDSGAATTDGKTDAEKYDGVFKVGYSAKDISYTEDEMPYTRADGTKITKIQDPIYATCVAFNDGEKTVLVYSIDTQNIRYEDSEAYKLRIQTLVKIPKENIIFSTTHNHSAPHPSAPHNTPAGAKHNTMVTNKIVDAAKEAIADLTDAEMYYGTAKTTGMAWVRRWVHEDGVTYSNTSTPKGLQGNTPVAGPASEADDTLQMIRFVRKDKKDVLMINWQAHLASAVNALPTTLTADLMYYIRDAVEGKEDEVMVAYFAGASGNINLTAPTPELRQYGNYQQVGKALGKLIFDSMGVEKLTRIEAGEITMSHKTYKAEMWKDSEERIAQAKETIAEKDPKKQEALQVKYNFNTMYAPEMIVSRNNNKATTIDCFLSALSFGDFALVAAPYEMFDNNGMQIKEGSPYKATFILTNADGALAYLPSIEAYTIYGGYEVDNCNFAPGEGEKLVAVYIDMLKKHKEKS